MCPLYTVKYGSFAPGHLQRAYDRIRGGDLAQVGGEDFFQKCFVFNGFEQKYLMFAAGATTCTYNAYNQQLIMVNQVSYAIFE